MIDLIRNWCFFFTTVLIILSILIISGKGTVLDCYRTTDREYDGHQQTTEDGEACVRWDSFIHGFLDPRKFPDETLSDAANYCRNPEEKYAGVWCYTGYDTTKWKDCGIKKCADVSLTKCGRLYVEQPTLLGKNVTFKFTPDKIDTNAIVEWQRTNKVNRWATLPFQYKFTQYSKHWTHYLILTDTVRGNDEIFYRVHYYNESMHCLMETHRLALKVPPSAPEFDFLQDIDDCEKCVVGEDGDKVQVICKTSGGTEPVKVSMSIGSESLCLQKSNFTAGEYVAFFYLLRRHHMALVTCTVTNDALLTPLNVTARVYVLKKGDEDEKAIIWIILTSCFAALLIAVLIAFLAERHKRKTAEAKLEANQVNLSAIGNGVSGCYDEPEDHRYEQLKGAAHGRGHSEDTYSQLTS